MANEIILGIDPGIVNIGYGLVKVTPNTKKLIEYGVIVSKHSEQTDRLLNIYNSFSLIFNKYSINKVVFERPTALKGEVGENIQQALGVVKLLVGMHSITTLVHCSAKGLKKVVTDNAKASKQEVQEAVRKYFSLSTVPSPDHAADALGCVIWYLKK